MRRQLTLILALLVAAGVAGAETLGWDTSRRIESSLGALTLSLVPATDNAYNLGSSSFRWATVYAGILTATLDGDNAATELAQLTNSNVPTTGQTGDTAALSFDLTGSVAGVSAAHEAARIEAYKASDWFHAGTEADHDSGLKFYATNSGTTGLVLTLANDGAATFAGALSVTGGADLTDTVQIVGGGVGLADDVTDDGLQITDVSLVSEGATGNAFETTLQFADPGVDATVTIPAVTGTTAISGTDDLSDWTFDTLDFADSAATSKIAFTGAVTAGTAYTLIDFSGATGATASTDYLLYQSATNYWRGDGPIQSSGWIRSAAYFLSSQGLLVNGGIDPGDYAGVGYTDYAVGEVTYEGDVEDTDEFHLEWKTAFDAYDAAGNSGDVTVTTGYVSGAIPVTSTTPGGVANTVGDLRINGSYSVPFTSDTALQVGMIVTVDAAHATCGAATNCVEAAVNSTDAPVGIYQGATAATAHASTLYSFAIGGLAYVAPMEDKADVALGDIAYAQNDGAGYAGYAEFSATVAGANHNAEVGHALVAEVTDEFDGAADVDPTENTIANVNAAWAVGDPVIYWDSADTPPTGMTDGAVYWICSQAAGTVRLSATKPTATCNAASSLDITLDGVGATQYLQRLPLCLIHWN